MHLVFKSTNLKYKQGTYQKDTSRKINMCDINVTRMKTVYMVPHEISKNENKMKFQNFIPIHAYKVTFLTSHIYCDLSFYYN